MRESMSLPKVKSYTQVGGIYIAVDEQERAVGLIRPLDLSNHQKEEKAVTNHPRALNEVNRQIREYAREKRRRRLAK